MATKQLNTTVRDNGLQAIITAAGTANTVFMAVCEGQPATFSDASLAKSATPTAGMRVSAEVALAAADLTLGNVGAETGIFAGRQIAVAAKAGVSVTDSTSATPDLVIVLYNKTSSTLYVVNEETSNQVLTAGGTVDIPTWNLRIAGAVS